MVFNTVFKHQTRSETSLVSAWYDSHNNDQKEAWDRLRAPPQAGPDLATHMQWVQTVNTAVGQLGATLYPAVQQPHVNNVNPAVGQLHRPKEKPQRTPRVQWDDEMRLVLHLLVPDPTLNPEKRTVIFNALFRDVLAGQRVAHVSEEKTNSHWSRRNEKRKVNEGHQAESTKPTMAQKWQRIINGPQTREEEANLAKWRKAIEEQKARLGYLPAQKPSKKSQQANVNKWKNVIEEYKASLDHLPAQKRSKKSQQVEEKIRERKPEGNQGKASVDMHEDVDGVLATAVGDSGGETTATAVGTEDNIQENGPGDGRTAQEGGGDVTASVQYRFQVQEAIIDLLHRSSPEDAAEVQQLFQRFNRNTVELGIASLRLLRVRQALQNLQRR